MKTRYGIHTIQMTMLLSRKWYDKMFETLSQKKGDGVFYKDMNYQSDAGIEKHICTYFCNRGVVLYLFVQKKHKNKTKRNSPCFLQFRINPLTLIEGRYSPKDVFQAKDKQLKMLESGMNDLLREIGLNKTFEQLKLSRIDCCLDCFPESQEYSDEVLRIIRRSPYMRSYHKIQFPYEDPHHKQKNKHSWRIKCKSIILTVYDKAFQLLEEELIEQPSGPMLRIEVSRNSASFQRSLSDEIKGSNQKILKTIQEDAQRTIQKYLKSVNTGRCYIKFERCIERIDAEIKNRKTRSHMKKFAEKLSKCKSYAQAVENSGLSKSQIKTVRSHFKKLGISPITLRNQAKMDELSLPGFDRK